jgi:predicted sulfurtransferase
MMTTSVLRRQIASIIILIIIPMALCFRAPFLSSSRLVGRYSATRLFDSLDSNAQSRLPTNQELVERRLETQRAKKESRERTLQERFDRNIRLKRLLHTQTTDNNDFAEEFQVPPLYAIKVWVDQDLRKDLKLSGREKRGRVFIESASDGVQSIKGLKSEMHAFFAALKKNSYLLAASLPNVAPDGTLLSPDESNVTQSSWPIETSEDVVKTFQAADQFFATFDSLKRPSIQILVLKDPNAPPPPPPPTYLENMPNPKASETMTMLSFYAFPPAGIEDPDAFAYDLSKRWKPFQALGRVYVAQEGVNAQMSVPTNILENFMQCCRSFPEFEFMENGINIDAVPLTVEEFQEAGVAVNGKPAPPFRGMHVRVRNQVVADGLDKPLNWQSAGYDMPPMEWHAKLKEAREKRAQAEVADDTPILLDCRNSYETDVGIFDGAEPLDTENFRETWDVLKERLAETPKDAPIMTYCTGGKRYGYEA